MSKCEVCNSTEDVEQVGAFLDDDDWIWMCKKCLEDEDI